MVDRLSRIRDSEDFRGLSARGGEEVALPLQPRKLSISLGTGKALVATGKEAFVKLWKAAGVYGELLDLLKAHKWIDIKLASDDTLRAAHKLNRKRGIDVLRESYERNNGETPTEQFSEAHRRGEACVYTPLVCISSW